MPQVLPGSRIPADGRVHNGQAYVDESMITGESKPVLKRVGDEVISGSMNGSGSMIIQVVMSEHLFCKPKKSFCKLEKLST